MFITFEGIDCSGKSTQIERLVRRLRRRGRAVLVVREPGGTQVSEAIREILLNPLHHNLHARTELLLYAAARAQIVEEKIKPALKNSQIVICDRYIDSTTAYQGVGRQLDKTVVRTINTFATSGLKPDCTILLDLSTEAARHRKEMAGSQKDRLEREKLAFHERVRTGYLAIAHREPDRILVLDADAPVETIAEHVWKRVAKFL